MLALMGRDVCQSKYILFYGFERSTTATLLVFSRLPFQSPCSFLFMQREPASAYSAVNV
jgi:hypothetical protein